MFSPIEEYVLNGGFVLQVLDSNQMLLRLYYFENSGLPFEFGSLELGDLIQVCRETREIVLSRKNLLYSDNNLSAEDFDEFINMMLAEVYQQTVGLNKE